jgi:adenylate cyclase
VAEPPIRLIKLIGDAAMLVCTDVARLVDAAQQLAEAAAEDDSLPRLRAGIAAGEALSRGGDWYGSPVNLASRITDVADPGTVVASDAVVEETSGTHRWTGLGARRLKGIDEDVTLHLLDSRPSRSTRADPPRRHNPRRATPRCRP